MEQGSDARPALERIFGCLQSAFKQYGRSARKRAWDSLQSSKGKEQVQKLLNNPSYQVVGIPGLVRFKEWYLRQQK